MGDHPISHPVECLQIDLLRSPDLYEAHRRTRHGFRDSLCIDDVVLVRLYKGFTNCAGTIRTAWPIDGAGGGVPVHLGFLYFEQKLSDGAIDIKAGRLPVQTDFGTLKDSCDFVSLTVCSTRGLNANLGWTSYPRATWGASVAGKVSDAVTLRTGVYEVNPHTGGDSGFHWALDGEGIMVPAGMNGSPRSGTG